MYVNEIAIQLSRLPLNIANNLPERQEEQEGLQVLRARPRCRRRGRRDGRPREALRPHLIPLRGSEVGGDGGAARRLRRVRLHADGLRKVAGVPGMMLSNSKKFTYMWH